MGEQFNPSLAEVETAIRESWSAETTYARPDYLARAPERPERGQCGPTALVVQDLLGGDLMMGDVDGDPAGAVHYWNRLDGTEIDLTRAQFLPDEHLVNVRAVTRPGMLQPSPGKDAYLLLRERVLQRLA